MGRRRSRGGSWHCSSNEMIVKNREQRKILTSDAGTESISINSLTGLNRLSNFHCNASCILQPICQANGKRKLYRDFAELSDKFHLTFIIAVVHVTSKVKMLYRTALFENFEGILGFLPINQTVGRTLCKSPTFDSHRDGVHERKITREKGGKLLF